LRIGEQQLSLATQACERIPFIGAPALRQWFGMLRDEAHEPKPAKNERQAANCCARKSRRILMWHPLNRAGILKCGVDEHMFACHISRTYLVAPCSRLRVSIYSQLSHLQHRDDHASRIRTDRHHERTTPAGSANRSPDRRGKIGTSKGSSDIGGV